MGLRGDYNTARNATYQRLLRRRRNLRLAGIVLGVLILSAAITAVLQGEAEKAANEGSGPVSGIASSILAPLPMQGGDGVVMKHTYGPQRQEGSYTLTRYDAASIRQPVCGQVDLRYFADAAFLGDSLTEGFTEYDINLGGALVCGYLGIGPDTVVKGMTVEHIRRGSEVVKDVLAAAQPRKLYILLGTNTLTTLGMEESFLGYYGQMLDELRELLGPDCLIYVQSVPPVRPAVQQERPGLASDVLRRVNEHLAQMAAEKGCLYLDLWEALADTEGALKDNLDAPDGIHLSPGNGYGAWVEYLRTHARYGADNPWTPGSAYAG